MARGLPEFIEVNPDLAAGLMETLSRDKDGSVRRQAKLGHIAQAESRVSVYGGSFSIGTR